MPKTLIVRTLDRVDYEPAWQRMKALTDTRGPDSADEIWLLEHPPVFTQGQAGKPEHVLAPGNIPVIPIDRGGQVTYHGPGQLVGYLMLDLRRLNIGARQLVTHIENALIELLKQFAVNAVARADAPGVYVGEKKIASLGLRIRKGCSYHGLALNTCMDLAPFSRINPCGYAGMQVTQLSEYAAVNNTQQLHRPLIEAFLQQLAYTSEPYEEVKWVAA
ncbi:MAG TPA: lipoyl(octanoyl) transferase LipB [Pseudomonadales bacterium]|nr:lipoyl(octanoyl) transferase LipB [Pseudomonadales bacterium]